MHPYLTHNRIGGVLCLVLSVAIWLATRTFPEMDAGFPDPSLFPQLIAVGLAISGLLLMFLPDQAEKLGKISWKGSGALQAVLLILLVAAVPLIVSYTGFIPAIAGLVFLVGMLFRIKLWIAAITAAITSGLVYVIFVLLLNVPL